MNTIKSLKRFLWSGIPTVFLFCLLQAILSVYLCIKFYKTNGPFYDSLSYHLTLAMIVSKAQSEGVLSALQTSLHGSTVFLPMATGAIIGPFVELHRSLGVWIQFPWIVALTFSSRYCFITWLKMDKIIATFTPLLFISIHAIYYYNGGLSDFRMDLLLYLHYGCSMCWFLAAVESKYWRDWLLCGIFCAATCLSRATAPVYLSLTMLIVVVIHLLFFGLQQLRTISKGLAIISTTVILCAGWFYWINFNHLYYYYVVWNPDANAHLAFSESIQHLRFSLQSVGWPILSGALAILGIALSVWLIQNSRRNRVNLSFTISNILKSFVIAVIPVTFLVFRGAGLNPFVSMPSAFGVVLFLLVCASYGLRTLSPSIRSFVMLLVLVSAGASAWDGATHFGLPPATTGDVQGYLQIAKGIEQDAKQHDLRKVRPCIITIGAFTGRGFMSVMLFDGGYKFLKETELTKEKIIFDMNWQSYDPSSIVEWDGLPVQGESERIAYLAQQAQLVMTHLIAPDDATLKKLPQHCYINTVSQRLRDAILSSGTWERIGPAIQLSPQEKFYVYAHRGGIQNVAHNLVNNL